jgi:hypothetical protein
MRFVCPHAVIRTKVYDAALLKDAPPTFKSVDAKFKEFPAPSSPSGLSGRLHRLQLVRTELPRQG